MHRRVVTLLAVVLTSLFFNSSTVAQQRYVCRSSSGSNVISDRPCASAPSTGLVYYGPTQDRQSTTGAVSRTPDAPEHLQYLGARCSALSDAIRTGATRGLKYDVISNLQREYQRECADDDRNARTKLSEERQNATSAKKASQQMAAMSQQDAQLKKQQCDESKRIVFFKKKRTDLTEGEKAELQRFEDNYKARCE